MKSETNPEVGKCLFWVFPILVIILTLFVGIGKCAAQADSIAYKFQMERDTAFEKQKVIEIFLEMERVVTLPEWEKEDWTDAYYVRLDYFDLLKEVWSKRPILEEAYYLILIHAAILEMDIFERLNEER